MSFAEQLKAERQRIGLNQADLAAVLEVPPRTYWEWEAGKTEPHLVCQEGALARLRKTKKRRK